MKYAWLCFLDYNLVNIYKAMFPRLQSKKGKLQDFISRLQSKKEKDNAFSTNQNLDSRARLSNGKMLGTHTAQTKSGLLDSKWPFIYAFEWCIIMTYWNSQI